MLEFKPPHIIRIQIKHFIDALTDSSKDVSDYIEKVKRIILSHTVLLPPVIFHPVTTKVEKTDEKQ